MSILFTDIVEVTPIVRDTTYRTDTEGTPFESEAFVEEESIVNKGADGSPVESDMLILFPFDTSIYKGDNLRVIKLKGVILLVTDQQYRKRKVTSVFRVGTRRGSHLEVRISGSQ